MFKHVQNTFGICPHFRNTVRTLKVAGPMPLLSYYGRTVIGTNKGKADTMSESFKQQFTDPVDEQLHPFIDDPRPLEVPIKEAEVEKTNR